MPCCNPKEHHFDPPPHPEGTTFCAFSTRRGRHFVFLTKGLVGASLAGHTCQSLEQRPCPNTWQTAIMSIIKGAESHVIAMTSPQSKQSVVIHSCFALEGGIRATVSEPPSAAKVYGNHKPLTEGCSPRRLMLPEGSAASRTESGGNVIAPFYPKVHIPAPFSTQGR